MTTKIIILCVAGVIVGGILLFFFTGQEKEEFQLVPQRAAEKTVKAAEVAGTEVGTGWSTKEDPKEAAKEAVGIALKGKISKTPDFAIIFASSGSDMAAILSAARQFLGKDTKIFGGTSDSRAVMTDRGFVKVAKRGYYEQATMEGARGLAIMTVTSEDIVFGVGSANFLAYPSVQEASKEAVLSAIRSAGKSETELPKVVLLTPTIGVEDEVIEGIEQVVGQNTLIIGGTTGGPAFAVIGENGLYNEGVSLAVVYTDLPVGWTFEGGFDVTDRHSGIVTKTEGQAIVEIDNRPALDVYDEWLGGKIKRLHEEIGKADVIRDLLTLHPLYRRYTSHSGQDYFLFSHPWPEDDQMKDRSVLTSTRIKPGERVYLSHGTWETLINRIGKLPTNAKIRGGIGVGTKPVFSIGFICGGVMGVIPETEREKLSFLINYTNNNAPFIANFTWGEQGHFPGIGNKHGNLLTSFVVIGPEDTKE